MPELLRMPGIAANTEEAVLSGWPVEVGKPFAAGDVIATVETAKANVDVEAPAPGVIVRVLAEEGASVQVGDAIALIARVDEQVSDVDGALAGLGVGAAVPEPAREQPERAPRQRVFASPLARKLAREAGIAFESLDGTGPDGRIVRADVERAIGRQQQDRQDRRDQRPEPVQVPTSVHRGQPDLVPHSRLRRAIARRLGESKATVPHFYLRGSARVDALLCLRTDINKASPVKVSVNDLVVKAVAVAHRDVPAVNVSWTDDGMRVFDTVDLGVAVATGGGLVTPVLRGVDRLGLSQIASATKDFAERAKRGALRQDELEGGSATVTNLGMYGTEEFTAIINPPQSTILAVGAARREPVVTETGTVEPATVLRVTLSVDHRAIDGALAAEWMRAFLAVLEQPLRILL